MNGLPGNMRVSVRLGGRCWRERDPDRNATEAGNNGMMKSWMGVVSVKPCGRCHRASCIESCVRAMGWGWSIPILVQEPVSSPVWGVDTGRCDATPCAEFGVRAAPRKAIPRRIGESRCFVSLQSELRPNQNGPCLEGQMGESGQSTSTRRGVRPGVGRVHGGRFMGPVERESLPMPTPWNRSAMKP